MRNKRALQAVKVGLGVMFDMGIDIWRYLKVIRLIKVKRLSRLDCPKRRFAWGEVVHVRTNKGGHKR